MASANEISASNCGDDEVPTDHGSKLVWLFEDFHAEVETWKYFQSQYILGDGIPPYSPWFPNIARPTATY